MMDIDFKVISVSSGKSDVDVIAYTEGEVNFLYEGQRFLLLEHCLLVEFAIELVRWLEDAGKFEGAMLYYVSMDEEEEPLLSLTSSPLENDYEVGSCWLLSGFKKRIPFNEAVFGARIYIENLKTYFAREFDVDLDTVFQRVLSR
ncbi:hypothetical protein [Pseudomonas sp. efr-133-TYG-103a]|jgi:hypothetical protein|uniref:DUF7878 domain-containing protein n=1 Tax=Pseudomonas sp. efr-133-TYG-103a TaxID=3040308 RepID=UPI0025549B9C|nr:hypothetical protein [Pseudomonas sp. efr-133-TYG-103a]